MYGPILDNSCDSGDTLAIGIFARFSWELNPYIAGRCYYSDSGQNHPGTQTIVAIPKNLKEDISKTKIVKLPTAELWGISWLRRLRLN